MRTSNFTENNKFEKIDSQSFVVAVNEILSKENWKSKFHSWRTMRNSDFTVKIISTQNFTYEKSQRKTVMWVSRQIDKLKNKIWQLK